MMNLKLSTRLILAFAILAALIALVGGAGLWSVTRVNEQSKFALRDIYPKVERFETIREEGNLIARAVRNIMILSDPAQVAQQFEQIEAAGKRLNDALEIQHETINEPLGIAGLKRLDEAKAEYDHSLDRLLGLLRANRLDEAKAALEQDLRPRQLAYMAQVNDLVSVGGKLMARAGDDSEAQARLAYEVVIGGIAIALFVAAFMGAALVRATTRPLALAVTVARSVAAGDLTNDIRVNGTNETAQLMASLKEMQEHLHAIVQRTRNTAESVATASAQISSGSLDLSSRTEQQASALQQTAASMEQLGTTVRANADSAQQANQLALAASRVATRGGQAVSDVVETMRGISESSHRIADIIGVIDGIAFQTNILALNAAVEAARAGEQGRGFAVVASEVRSLAQRSAEAAKEIKSLITESTERVELGTSQVGRAGETIQEVVSSIKRVTDIVGEISAASIEQSSGVSQVGKAVSQMDETTQQNAALVEESAAAADSLKTQATQLVESMAVFKLAHGGSPARAPGWVPRGEHPRRQVG